jgi:hypothetical protein
MRLAHLLWIRAQQAWHRWVIDGDVEYLDQCGADGLIDSLSLRAFRDEIARRECAVIALEVRARALRQREVRV